MRYQLLLTEDQITAFTKMLRTKPLIPHHIKSAILRDLNEQLINNYDSINRFNMVQVIFASDTNLAPFGTWLALQDISLKEL
jgi:MarR-like DNA-binding transcriptional regulator SgrR of sgrS sRNA